MLCSENVHVALQTPQQPQETEYQQQDDWRDDSGHGQAQTTGQIPDYALAAARAPYYPPSQEPPARHALAMLTLCLGLSIWQITGNATNAHANGQMPPYVLAAARAPYHPPLQDPPARYACVILTSSVQSSNWQDDGGHGHSQANGQMPDYALAPYYPSLQEPPARQASSHVT